LRLELGEVASPARALIEDPDGLGFIAVVGSRVGTARHQIVAIRRGAIALAVPSSAVADADSRVTIKLGERAAGAGE
jgi:hypothetical protein